MTVIFITRENKEIERQKERKEEQKKERKKREKEIMASFPAFTKTYHKTAQPATEPTLPQNSAAGKVILVTGGGRGIGFRIAGAFARAGAAHVILLGRSQGTLEAAKAELEKMQHQQPTTPTTTTTTTTTKFHTFAADVSSADDLAAAFSSAVAATGNRGIDVCVANAGYSPDTLAPIRSQPMEEVWRTYEVNVRGVLHIVKAFLEHAAYADGGGGECVCFSSSSSSSSSSSAHASTDAQGTPGSTDKRPVLIQINTGMAHLPYFGPYAAYASSKAAAAKLIEYVQAEEDTRASEARARAGAGASACSVRLHNLQPGIVKTDMGSKSDLPDEAWDDSTFFRFQFSVFRFSFQFSFVQFQTIDFL